MGFRIEKEMGFPKPMRKGIPMAILKQMGIVMGILMPKQKGNPKGISMPTRKDFRRDLSNPKQKGIPKGIPMQI